MNGGIFPLGIKCGVGWKILIMHLKSHAMAELGYAICDFFDCPHPKSLFQSESGTLMISYSPSPALGEWLGDEG